MSKPPTSSTNTPPKPADVQAAQAIATGKASSPGPESPAADPSPSSEGPAGLRGEPGRPIAGDVRRETQPAIPRESIADALERNLEGEPTHVYRTDPMPDMGPTPFGQRTPLVPPFKSDAIRAAEDAALGRGVHAKGAKHTVTLRAQDGTEQQLEVAHNLDQIHHGGATYIRSRREPNVYLA